MSVLLPLHVVVSFVAIGRRHRHGRRASRARRRGIAPAAVPVDDDPDQPQRLALPADRILPSHVVGAISLVLLALAGVAWYRQRLAGGWRRIWVVTALASFYLNVFVLVVQAFLQGAGAARPGADPGRTAVCDRPGGGAAGLRRPHRRGAAAGPAA